MSARPSIFDLSSSIHPLRGHNPARGDKGWNAVRWPRVGDRLERKVDYAGNATLNQYNGLGHLTAVTGADGYTLGFDRDPLGRITGAYDEEGHRVSLRLDPDGKPRSVTDPNGLTTGYEYYGASQDGRLKRSTLPKVTGQSAGRAVEIAAYDGSGRPTQINALAADGTVRDSYRHYDELGRLVREVGPQTSATDTSRPVACVVYTALGDVAEIWAGGTADTTSKTCTLDGVNVKKQRSATYDDWSRKLSETDALGRVWRWTWNGHGELVSSQTPVQAAAGQSTNYAYGIKGNTGEVQGQLKSRTVPGAQTVAYTRDALGLVTRAETKNGSNQTVVAYDYAYDPAKRLASVTDSRPGGTGKSLTYTWTPGGRLAKVEDSDGHSTSFSYDAVGRLASLAAPNGETVSFVWDAGGRLIERRLNSGLRTTQSWFEDGSLKEKKNLYGATTLSSHAYTLDAQGRRATHAEAIGGTTKSWAYGYDYLDRLTSAADGTAETYGYDLFGNRRSKTKSGTTTAYLYDLAHQLSEIRSGSDTGALIGGAVHDADGHTVKLCEVASGGTVTKTASDCTASGTGATTLALAWNALDHLLAATRTGTGAVTESYAYDDQSRRIAKVGAGVTALYLYDGEDIHAEWASAVSGMPSAKYVHGVATDEPVLRLTGTTNGPGSTQAAYLQDGLGSAIAMADPAGTLTASQRFDAWGNKLSSSGTVPTYGYTGREPDATGLVFYRARYQHPGIGRFVSRDPAGMADAVSPYAYVANSPVNFTDPTGLVLEGVGLPGSNGRNQTFFFDSSIARNVVNFVRDAQAAGFQITVTSDFRTTAEQAQIHTQNTAKGLPAARPGTGYHETGFAVDVNVAQAATFGKLDPIARVELENIALMNNLAPIDKTRSSGFFPGVKGGTAGTMDSPRVFDPVHFQANPLSYGYSNIAEARSENQADYQQLQGLMYGNSLLDSSVASSQSLGSMTTGTSPSLYSGGATTGLRPGK
jgi:RHS repeat-associated protein